MSAAVAGSQIEVAEGKGGWLFLRRYEDVEPLRWGADLSAWKETHLPALTAQFAGRRARLAARGIAYVVAVAPEKGSVYPEELPPGHDIAAPTAAQLLTDACVGAQVEAVDLTSLLRSAKGPLDIYARVDSHWTFFGAYLGYRAIMETVGKTCPIPVLGPHELSYSDKEGFGDLGVHLTPERRGRVQQVDVKAGTVTTVSHAYDERERVMTVHTCERGRGKALVLRDSFSSFLAPYLSRTFAETTYVSPSLAMLDDMIGELKPDIVLHQCSERSLFYSPEVWTDWEPRSWRQIYLEVHQYPQHVRLIRPLRQALREWRFEDAVLLGRQLADVTGGELDHNLAEALAMSGAHASALQACLRAEAACGGAPFTYYLKALAQRALGHKAEALASLNEALAAHPGHAWFLFMLGSWLLEDGDALVAAPILQSAVDRAPAFAEGWRRLSQAYALLGNGPAVASTRRRADRLAGVAQDPKLEILAAQGQGTTAFPLRIQTQNPEIKLSVESTGRLHVVLSGSLAAISALTLRLNGRAWATLLTTPDVTASATQKLWSCELPPLFAPVEGEVVELVDAHTQALLDPIVLGKREPKLNGHGLKAAEVYAGGAAPLFSATGMAFDGALVTVYGAHLPPLGDPSKLRVVVPEGVVHTFEYSLPSPEFAGNYWYWPNADRSAFRVTINLPASSLYSDPFNFRFVHDCDGEERPGGTVHILNDFASVVRFPDDETQLTRVQTFDSPQTVAFGGYNAYCTMATLLEAHGFGPRLGLALLDWGCGHGRVTRHFLHSWRDVDVWGMDIDGENIAWCKRELSDGTFVHGPLWPPSPLPTERFDAVFAISVMTHLTADAQQAWLAELARVLKPGGLALLSFSGEAGVAYSSAFRDPAWWQRWKNTGFDDQQFDPVLTGKISEDGYYRSTHQTEAHVRNTWARSFDILAIERTRFGYQDVAIMRKR